uniref:Pleckstrin homology domain containing, family H (with MyTH4 domain) member 1 n=1 Tax=Oryzias latipes TaxID=8090 RepID=A0A3P9GYK6_ORYLA
MKSSAAASAAAPPVDWQKRCVSLEMQLLRFRLQAGKIRELLAEKMQDLEQRVTEADQRAERAEKQIHMMEEKLKSANIQTSDCESSLFRKYQDLSSRVQEKEALIQRLEMQLEKQVLARAQEAKIIEEKAAKIKDWVTLKLKEMEEENQQLKTVNLKQTEQILQLQEKLQSEYGRLDGAGTLWKTRPPDSSDGSVVKKLHELHVKSPFSAALLEKHGSPGAKDASLAPSTTQDDGGTSSIRTTATGVLPLMKMMLGQDEGGRFIWRLCSVSSDLRKSPELVPKSLCLWDFSGHEPLVRGGRSPSSGLELQESPENLTANLDRNNSSEELNSKFSSQSGSALRVTPKSPLLSRSPSNKNPFPCLPQPSAPPPGASMTLPKVRTPLTPRDSIQLVKKHRSQPQPGLDRLPHLNVDVHVTAPSSASSTLKSTGTASPFSQLVEETDIDDEPPDSSEGGGWGAHSEVLPQEGVSFGGLSEDLEKKDPEVLKPPTPPLHRFPSWESRIYAVAKAGMRVSEAGRGESLAPPTPLVYKNIKVPVYTTLKGKATQISNTPLLDDESGSEDDSSSLASSRTSILSPDRKGSVPGSPRAVKRGVSVSSFSSESDYAIPPDACSLDSDYSEPEQKVQRTSSYSCESINPALEKSGYLLKMSSQVKAWKRRWFILRNGEILYYKSPSDVIRKPQGQIELNSSCGLVHGEGAKTFQLITEKKSYFLTADSPNILEEWIRVLQNILKVQACSSVSMVTGGKPTMRGWLTKVKHGHSKLVWCSLVGKVFFYYRNQEDKLPLGQLQASEASVQEVDRSCDSDEDYEAGGRGFLSSHCTLVVQPREQSPTYLLIGTKQEKDAWLYHLTVAAGCGANFRVGTEYEQLIGKLLDADGDPDSPLWTSDGLSFSKEGLRSPHTTLPSEALQTEALKLFKSCQLFINVLVESPSVDYHTSLAQNALQVCLTHPELQNEMYCQLIKQTHRRTPHNHSLTQCWQLLSLCAVPAAQRRHQKFRFSIVLHQMYLKTRTEVGKYAVYCQRSLERTLQNGEREARPSRMEIISILLRNPYHHSLPFSIPVHFMNNTYQVVGFDGSTIVEEFLNTLNQRIAMRKPQLTGFALVTDDPSGKDLEHCLQPTDKICDVISKWEQALKEMHPGKNEGTRIVRLTCKKRLFFRSQVKGETERERLLLAYQVNADVQQGRFPVNKELALEVAALMAKVEHGDLERPGVSASSGSPRPQLLLLQVLERFYPKPYRQNCSVEQLRELSERLAVKWSSLRGCSASECVRIYLTVARKWPLFGAKLFSAKVRGAPPPSSRSGIMNGELQLSNLHPSAPTFDPQHTLVSYPYLSVITFGGCRDDFMVVTTQRREPGGGKKIAEKLIFAMPKPKVGPPPPPPQLLNQKT